MNDQHAYKPSTQLIVRETSNKTVIRHSLVSVRLAIIYKRLKIVIVRMRHKKEPCALFVRLCVLTHALWETL